MIRIATVHWKEDRWIDVQLGYLRRHVAEEFRVYAWLNDVPCDHQGKFHYSTTEPVAEHAIKLNLLADVIYADSDRDRDLLVFLDGDAFPVGDVIGFARRKLTRHALVAVQRVENGGDLQPHPCFCVTTVGFWKGIGGDWKKGHTWPDTHGIPTTDVGGNLLDILRRCGVDWCPMWRSNRVNLHPLWFGVYEGVVYHHGAGFRNPLCRRDLHALRSEAHRTWGWPVSWAIDRLPLVGKYRRRCERRRAIRRNDELSKRVYKNIVQDPLFHRVFTSGEPDRIRGQGCSVLP
jgi:hypothetical protein